MNLQDDDIAKKIAKTQIDNNYPGLMIECKDLLNICDIDKDDVDKHSKFTWKKKVKEAVLKVATVEILRKMKEYKKVNVEDKA